MLVYFYILVPGLFRLSSTLLLVIVFLIPRRLTLLGGWIRLSGMLVLYGTYRVHDKETKLSSAGAESAYCDGRCATAGLRISPV